jgi:uncharacterized protein YndB with AHSA1/START domain
MKALKILAGVAAGAVVLFLGAVMMQPDHSHIERSKVVKATPADVYPQLNDMNHWVEWNPWRDYEPTAKVTVSENPAGKGAWYTWEGEETGRGKMTIIETVDNQKVVDSLEFIEPFASKATVTFTLSPEGEGTRVVWAYDAEVDFMGKAFGLFMDMDKMLGGDFDKGLNKLAPRAEAAAQARVDAEAKAKAEAEAAAAAAAAAGLEVGSSNTAGPSNALK